MKSSPKIAKGCKDHYIYSTLPAGFQVPAMTILKKVLVNPSIDLVQEGFIVYRTESSVEEIERLKCVSNSFVILQPFIKGSPTTISEMIRYVLNRQGWEKNICLQHYKGKRSFRIVTSMGNKLVTVPRALKEKLEKRITRITGLKLSRRGADVEFWCYVRKEGCGFWSQRISKYPKITKRGELRPEIANIMCHLSEPTTNDIFLDPFCGHGAIPLQRIMMPYEMIFACDKDMIHIMELRKAIKQRPFINKNQLKRIVIRRDNALRMSKFNEGFVTRIVTDPPWGIFSLNEIDINMFYSDMITEMVRITRVGAIIVILTAQKNDLKQIAEANDSLKVLSTYDVLISGKKAAIYKLRKVNK